MDSVDANGRLKPRVFGAPLEEIVQKDNTKVPIVVSKCIDYLNRQNALETEGIFRVSGPKTEIEALKKSYEDDKKPDLMKVDDVHVITGVLKQFFRELPQPLLTYELYDSFLKTHEIESHEERARALRPIVQQLPTTNRETLHTLMNFTINVVKYEHKNKMTASNLATVLGPNLIYAAAPDPMTMKMDMEHGNSIVETMIEEVAFIFGGATQTKSRPTKSGSTLTVPGDVEFGDFTPTEVKTPSRIRTPEPSHHIEPKEPKIVETKPIETKTVEAKPILENSPTEDKSKPNISPKPVLFPQKPAPSPHSSLNSSQEDSPVVPVRSPRSPLMTSRDMIAIPEKPEKPEKPDALRSHVIQRSPSDSARLTNSGSASGWAKAVLPKRDTES
eukprot:TRINITY_DN7171_c0_g2_i1.p1 TRINITY_DN7171_c0_g2~~TRINITY_DN7171_c0_g2_i1.p1  ORF type:complete len:406 (+),score=101.87 TRINITY_DN7171_c0_g2_i1:55-1218(+)